MKKSNSATKALAELSGARLCAVLVIEDDPAVQSRIARQLTRRGHRAVGASTVEGAAALLSAFPVDFVILGESVPRGLTLAKQLHKERPEVPVVLLTANPGRSRSEALLDGVVALLALPFRSEALAELLDRLIPTAPRLATA